MNSFIDADDDKNQSLLKEKILFPKNSIDDDYKND
jgi:hypothetical protein